MVFWALAGVYQSIWMLFAGSVFRGIGVAFQSGSDVALIYEIMAELRKRKLFTKVYSQIISFHQMGLLISAIVGMIVTYYLPLIYLVFLSILPAFFNIFIILKMKNPKSCFDEKLSPLDQLKKSITLLKRRKKLRSYVSMSVLDSGILLTLYRFEALYFAQLIPLYLINVVRIITHTTGYFSFLIIQLFKKMSFLLIL
jgi:MFS family permease